MKRTRIIAEEEFPDKRSSSKSANLTVEVNINQCDECRKIDLEGALNFPAANIKDAKGIWVADIRPKHVTKHASTCSLCHVWSGMLSENDSYRNNSLIPTTIGLRAFSIMRNLEEIDQWRVPVAIRSQLDNSILGLDLIKQNSYLVRTSTDPTVSSHWSCAREVSPQVDYKLLLDWLEFCSKHHSKSCNADRLHRLESFMAIDCDSGKLVSPPSSCTYAALSYVWGAKSSTEQVDHDTTICTTETNQSYLTLDERAPRIVQDAIIVTKELGLKYLWIDKYCINQKDQNVKSEQIGKMDLIYSSAEFTIVAAAGSDENHGLPGVNTHIRKDLYGGDLGGLRRVTSQTQLYRSIKESKWWTRGWTYQEAMLSRRRIVFTETELYFECCGMHCREAVCSPLRLLHRKDMKNFMSWIRPGFFAGAGGVSTSWSKGLNAAGPFCERRQPQFVCHVENFTARQLSYDTDSLAALLGILRTFESAVPPIYHISGLPIVREAAGTATRSFISALGWSHNNNHNFRSPKRRSAFPSWSWIGWEATALFLKDDSSFTTFEVEVWIMDRSKTFLALEASDQITMSSQVLSSEISKVIRLSAWVVESTIWLEWRRCPVRNIRRAPESGLIVGFCVSLHYISDKNYCWVNVSQEIQQIGNVFEKLLDSRFSCIILGSGISSVNMLLVEWQPSKEFVTRVGTISMVGTNIADIQRWKLERRFIELQ